jgi:hypothetical protein
MPQLKLTVHTSCIQAIAVADGTHQASAYSQLAYKYFSSHSTKGFYTGVGNIGVKYL